MTTKKKTQPAAPKRTRAKRKPTKRKPPVDEEEISEGNTNAKIERRLRLTAAQRATLTDGQIVLLERDYAEYKKIVGKMKKAEAKSGARRGVKRVKPETLGLDGKPKKWKTRTRTNEGTTFK